MGSVQASGAGYIPAKCGGETRGGGGAHDVVAQARGDTDMALHKGPVVSAQWSRGKILALGTSVRLQGIPGSNPGWAPFCLLLPSVLFSVDRGARYHDDVLRLQADASSIPQTKTSCRSRRLGQPSNDLPPHMTRKALKQRPIPPPQPVEHQPLSFSRLSLSSFPARPLLAPHPAYQRGVGVGVRIHRVGVGVAFAPPGCARPRTARCGHRHVQHLR